MPARRAMALVLAAWKPCAANSFTAASITCSRRCSELARAPGLVALDEAMPASLLIDLSDVKVADRPHEGAAALGEQGPVLAAGLRAQLDSPPFALLHAGLHVHESAY